MASTLTRIVTFARAPLNAVSFAGRSVLRWERGAPSPFDEPKDALFGYLAGPERAEAEVREEVLRARYDLDPLRAASTRHTYRENVYLLDALERLFDGVALGAPRLRAIDVGAQAWGYATALERFFRTRGEHGVDLTGVEIDGHGIYRDGHSRADHARAHAAGTGNPAVRYRVADFLDAAAVPETDLDVVTLLYPFVSRYALLRWGLPLRMFRPDALLTRVVSVLRPGGGLVVFNQTPAERDRVVVLAEAAGARVQRTMPIGGRLVAYHARTDGRTATLLRAP